MKLLRKGILLLAALAMGLALAAKPDFTLIHSNDVYEIQPVKRGKLGGAARVATLIKQLDDGSLIVTFGGDAFSPSIMSSLLKGKQMVDVFNKLGFDFAAYGNHEFDFGPAVAEQRVKESNFPWLSSNLLDKRTGEPLAGGVRFAITEVNGVKVGFIGLIDDWLELTSPGDNAQYLDFVTVGRDLARKLKAEGADVVVALTHMDMIHDEELAAKVPEIDLILGAHDHGGMFKVVNGTLIFKAKSNWRDVGYLKVYTIPGLKPVVFLEVIPVTNKIPEDPAMAKVVDEYVKILDQKLNVTIGETKVPLDARRKTVRTMESNIGNLIADAMRDYAQADAAIANGGGIRTDSVYGPGPLTRKDILAILPFGNVVISVKVSGADLKAALENGVSQVERVKGRFPQVSGITFTYDPAAEPGQRVKEVYVNGQPLDPNKTYVVAVNDYMGRGGDGYGMFKDAPRVIDERSGLLLAGVVMNYIEAHSPVAPKVEDRIKTTK